ncbi:hypothetical protein RO3G_01335 [Rhizopus delemar RA 99-880]|uniref:Uncharacterized protein n=1 Tax=Rhizopus delemar (strain RA 99-880 / ATCC MYA-4621 / FGSC 9543 / NRRL 43880) TaxID=246409 RepID=I1BKA1_RHIO9|nr:hypothetical protein RO3G_01335 [Rhizopus delemar RA 99-880]|eukprot:EIE76631.1 hypothetical protein RO3G_01335 [Rhizopus delemar RA 99-880]
MARRPIESDSEQEHEYSDESEQEYDDNEQGSILLMSLLSNLQR